MPSPTSDDFQDDGMEDLPDPRTLPRNALDKEGWKALALAWKRRADAVEQQISEKRRRADALEQDISEKSRRADALEQQALEIWQVENERRKKLGILPLPPLDSFDDSDDGTE